MARALTDSRWQIADKQIADKPIADGSHDSETLRAAQKKPDDYRGLMVRVAGYSAYFVELNPEVQEDIISRTVHESV